MIATKYTTLFFLFPSLLNSGVGILNIITSSVAVVNQVMVFNNVAAAAIIVSVTVVVVAAAVVVVVIVGCGRHGLAAALDRRLGYFVNKISVGFRRVHAHPLLLIQLA